MKQEYADILSRIKEEPTWYTETGVPRYGKFSPEMCSSAYAESVALLKVCCQSCKKEFLVEMVQEKFLTDHSMAKNVELWIERDKDRHRQLPLHYGDPPVHGCPTGEVAGCYDLKIEEFWHREHLKWVRITSYEIELENKEGIQCQK